MPLFFVMAFRTIVINKASKISLDLNNIVIYYDNEPYWINLDDISVIIIEDPRCLVSLKLLTSITEKGIDMIFCNSSHMPIGSLQTLHNNTRHPKKIKQQIEWNIESKKYLWTKIVEHKIKLQIDTLIMTDKLNKIDIMNTYLNTIENNDISNREGLASRTYFKELFGNTFKRFNEDIINFTLNYVYQIIRSKISQEIVNCGYHPSIGIRHCSEYNNYNLADDFIEVYRPIVDYHVYNLLENCEDNFLTPSLKDNLVDIINNRIKYNNCEQKIHISITLYLQNMFSFLESGDINKIIFPDNI